jgi:hypothetical protein
VFAALRASGMAQTKSQRALSKQTIIYQGDGTRPSAGELGQSSGRRSS